MYIIYMREKDWFYFKELAQVTVGAGKCKICGMAGRLEIPVGVNVLVLRQNTV